MARRYFEMFDIAELLQHWYANRPKAVIAESLGVDRATVRKYIGRAEGLGLKPGGPPLSQGEWDEVARRVAPELMDPKVRSLTYSLIDPLKDKIDAMLEASTVTTVHQRLRDEQGLAVGISSFRRYCHLVFPDKGLRDKVTILRPDVDPGEEAQVDYGFLGTFADRVTGKMRRVWAFVIVLSFSRHMFVRPVLKMDQVSWVTAHVAAFEYFGGVPQRLVSENVPRNIFHVLWPIALCGRWRRCPPMTRTFGHHPPHNDQSDESHSSRVSSDCQTGRARGPTEEPGGSVFRSASIFALVLISA